MNIANDQRTLKEIENKILYMLANASGKYYHITGETFGGGPSTAFFYMQKYQRKKNGVFCCIALTAFFFSFYVTF